MARLSHFLPPLRFVAALPSALFHLLVAEACEAFVEGAGLGECRAALAREFEHRTMRAVSDAFAAAKPPVFEVCPSGVPDELMVVARTFVRLQKIRLVADYEPGSRWSAATLRECADGAQAAFLAWRRVRREPAARVYLLALLTGLPRSR